MKALRATESFPESIDYGKVRTRRGGPSRNYHSHGLRAVMYYRRKVFKVGHGDEVRGEKNGRAKLTEAQVMDIRLAYSNGLGNMPYLATKYGVSEGTIRNIVHRRTWGHVQ